MPRGPRAPSKRSSACGSRSGSISPLQGAAGKSRRPHSPGTSTPTDVVGQPRAQLGAIRRRALIAGPDSRPPSEGDQSGCGDAGHANQASSALQTPSSPSMGVQPGVTSDSPTLYGATPVEMYKLFFGPQVACPELTEDAGLSCNRPDTQVSSSESGRSVCLLF